MNKYARISLIYAIIILLLFGLVEVACRINARWTMISLAPKDSSVQARMKMANLDKAALRNELGSKAFEKPPAFFLSSFNEDVLKKYVYEDLDQTKDQNRQWVYAPDGQSRTARYVKKIKNTDIVVFDVNYRFNTFEKRYVENQDQKKTTSRFVLAAGDSFTFGEGVNQGQDYPSILASLLSPEWKVYNYGLTGESANDLFTRISFDQNYFLPIKEKSGVFIWVYHDVQMQRLVFPATAYKKAPYIATKAEYVLEDNYPIFYGIFNKSQRPYRTLIDFLGSLSMTETFHLEIPKVYTEEHFQLFFSLLNLSVQKMIERNFRVTKKILVTYTAHNDFPLLKKKAEENGFEVLDIEKLLYLRDKHFGGDMTISIPVDGHPSPEAYWLLANALHEKFFK